MNTSSATRRVNQIMAKVSPDIVQSGKDWYTLAHTAAETLASKYTLPVERVAGIIAVLSPGTRWERNLVDAESIIRDGEDAIVTTYTPNKLKALAILRGADPFIVVGGNKVTSFFINILDPRDDFYVTIDRWMLRTFGIIDAKEQKRFFGGDKQYKVLAECIRRKAKDYGVLPCQLQAIVWEYTRRAA